MNITDRTLVSLSGLRRRFSPLLHFVFLFGIISADIVGQAVVRIKIGTATCVSSRLDRLEKDFAIINR